MANIIDGKAFAATIRSQVKEDADRLIEQSKVEPCLAVVLVGENPASKVYVGAKTKMALIMSIIQPTIKRRILTPIRKVILELIISLIRVTRF